MSVEIDIDTSDYDFKLPRILEKSGNLGAQLIMRSVIYVDDIFGTNIPVRTGNLKNTRQRTIEPDRAEIRTTTGYGKFVNDDTRPHIIKGNPFLRIPIDGKVIFRRQVMHPGTKGQKFKEKTLSQSREGIEQIMRESITEMLN